MPTELTNPFERLEAAGFDATTETISEIARLAAAGDSVTGRVGDVYLKILTRVAAGYVMAADVDPRLAALEKANGYAYPAVLEGITTDDVRPDPGLDKGEQKRRSLERNRRSNFARTSASALRGWISAGGELENLMPEHVTKQWLQEQTHMMRAAAAAAESVSEPPDSMAPRGEFDRAVNHAYLRLARSVAALNDQARAAFIAGRIAELIVQKFPGVAP